MNKLFILAIVFSLSLTVLLSAQYAEAVVFGVKTCGSGSPACGSVTVSAGGSNAPSRLFSFDEVPGSLTDIASIQLASQDVDVDALAQSTTHGLLGYQLNKAGPSTAPTTSSSQLVSINTITGVASPIGTPLNRDIRGAMFDFNGNLWVIDVKNEQANAELVKINPNTGSEISSTSLGQIVTTATDIAIRSDGTVLFVDLNNIYTLDLNTGNLNLLFTALPSLDNGLTGLAFSSFAPSGLLFTNEVNGFEDIHTFDLDNSNTRSTIYANFIPTLNGQTFNAGRGDLAALVDPDERVVAPVAGEIIPIETTSLLLAGAQSFSWMIPLVISALGIGLFVFRKPENS